VPQRRIRTVGSHDQLRTLDPPGGDQARDATLFYERSFDAAIGNDVHAGLTRSVTQQSLIEMASP
jgi:hypothetical protein